MDREKPSAIVAGVGLPPTGRFSSIQQTSPSTASSFSNDLSRMPDNPPKNTGHRRAHSEILTLPDDINFDSDLGVVGESGDGPSFSDDMEEDLFSMYIDMDKVNSEQRQLSGERVRGRHQHSQSMDGSITIQPEMLVSGADEVSTADAKKAISAAKLAELALIDPKRAKRIWANRQSAARSKERKMRYIGELECKVQTLQTEATSLSAQLTLLQRDTNGLSAENGELKIRLQSMEQQVHLQDALNDALKEEIQQMKMLTGQVMSNGGPMMNFPASYGGNHASYASNQAMNTLLTAQQFKQLHIHSQKQQQQFQQHQLHQLQPKQLQQPQHLSDFKLRQSMPSPKENMPDPKSSASKD